MNHIAHSVGGLAAGVGVTYFMLKYFISPVEIQSLYIIGGAWLGGLLPDIDHHKFYLGK